MQKTVILTLIRPREGEDFLNLIITRIEITMSFNSFQKVALLRNRAKASSQGRNETTSCLQWWRVLHVK